MNLINLIPIQYRLAAAIGVATVAMSAAFSAGWSVNGWRLDKEFSDYKMGAEMASKAAIEQTRTTEQEWQTKLNQERDNAAKREIQLRADADSADRASDGLRNQLSATARRIAEGSPGSCAAYVEKLSDVLSTSSERYTRVAEDADRWESYAITCHDSWPK